MSEPHTISFTFENDDGDEIVVDFPTRWEICDDCHGEGTTYLGWTSNEQPAFTQEDFEEEGYDFKHDYLSGAYDKDCPTCDGSGKIRVIDENSAESRYPEAFSEYLSYMKNEADYRAAVNAERRFNA